MLKETLTPITPSGEAPAVGQFPSRQICNPPMAERLQYGQRRLAALCRLSGGSIRHGETQQRGNAPASSEKGWYQSTAIAASSMMWVPGFNIARFSLASITARCKTIKITNPHSLLAC